MTVNHSLHPTVASPSPPAAPESHGPPSGLLWFPPQGLRTLQPLMCMGSLLPALLFQFHHLFTPSSQSFLLQCASVCALGPGTGGNHARVSAGYLVGVT